MFVVRRRSAGVGRTGTYIVIDAMLDRIQHEQTLDVYGHVTCLRAQRNYMVQTEDQYVFIYEALLDAVESGHTEVLADSLYLHVQHLTTLYVVDDPRQPAVTGMEIEFKVCEFRSLIIANDVRRTLLIFRWETICTVVYKR